MFKSKIFIKAMLIVTVLVAGYSIAVSIFIIPKINNDIKQLEEKNAKQILSKVVTIVKNVHNDLETFKESSLQRSKTELKHLTQTLWSMIDTRYYESIKNKSIDSEITKQKVLDHISKIRYGNDDYFYVSDYNSVLISHPYLKNKDMSNVSR